MLYLQHSLCCLDCGPGAVIHRSAGEQMRHCCCWAGVAYTIVGAVVLDQAVTSWAGHQSERATVPS